MLTESEIRTGQRTPGGPPDPERTPRIPRIDSRDLLRGGREVVIVHEGEEYRLRRTSQGKLILTK